METPISLNDIQPLKLAKIYFQSCIDHLIAQQNHGVNNTLRFILSKIDEHGGWPILHENGKWNSTDFDWIRTIAGLQREMNLWELIIVKVFQNSAVKNFIGDTILVSKPPAYRVETSNLLNTYDDSWEPEQIVSLCKTLLELTDQRNINIQF